jgi:two-component system, OmpR family, copper resistance phosphate regulon response regulator CusR
MRILVVEDEEKVARFVERGLKAELYTVDVATDGVTALYHLKEGGYDIIILDLNLPDFSGNEILRQMRKNGDQTPVLILTARGSIPEKVESFQEGADDYLTKPFSFTELLLRIRALARRSVAVSRTDSLQVGDLVLDRPSHQVKRGGRPIELTSKEFALLEYLMSNAGRVLSRTMIVEHVWDQSFEGLTNIVDVYMRQLRKKIDEGAPVKLLRTVRGVGYSISEETA